MGYSFQQLIPGATSGGGLTPFSLLPSVTQTGGAGGAGGSVDSVYTPSLQGGGIIAGPVIATGGGGSGGSNALFGSVSSGDSSSGIGGDAAESNSYASSNQTQSQKQMQNMFNIAFPTVPALSALPAMSYGSTPNVPTPAMQSPIPIQGGGYSASSQPAVIQSLGGGLIPMPTMNTNPTPNMPAQITPGANTPLLQGSVQQDQYGGGQAPYMVGPRGLPISMPSLGGGLSPMPAYGGVPLTAGNAGLPTLAMAGGQPGPYGYRMPQYDSGGGGQGAPSGWDESQAEAPPAQTAQPAAKTLSAGTGKGMRDVGDFYGDTIDRLEQIAPIAKGEAQALRRNVHEAVKAIKNDYRKKHLDADEDIQKAQEQVAAATPKSDEGSIADKEAALRLAMFAKQTPEDQAAIARYHSGRSGQLPRTWRQEHPIANAGLNVLGNIGRSSQGLISPRLAVAETRAQQQERNAQRGRPQLAIENDRAIASRFDQEVHQAATRQQTAAGEGLTTARQKLDKAIERANHLDTMEHEDIVQSVTAEHNNSMATMRALGIQEEALKGMDEAYTRGLNQYHQQFEEGIANRNATSRERQVNIEGANSAMHRQELPGIKELRGNQAREAGLRAEKLERESAAAMQPLVPTKESWQAAGLQYVPMRQKGQPPESYRQFLMQAVRNGDVTREDATKAWYQDRAMR